MVPAAGVTYHSRRPNRTMTHVFSRFWTALTFLGALVTGAGRRHLGLIAAGVGFYGLMAIFPGITSLVTLWGFFADPAIVEQQTQALEPLMPEDAFLIVEAQVQTLANGPKTVLGWASALSILAALWATRAGVAAMIEGLNAAYGTPPRRGFRKQLFALLLTILLILVALVALNTVVVVPVVVSFLHLGPFTGLAIEASRWLIGILVVLLGIGVLYRFGPNRPGKKSRLISAGTITAVLLWALVSWGFSLYIQNFSSYNDIYGSLGAVVVMLMWLYLSAFAVLIGGLVNAQLEQ